MSGIRCGLVQPHCRHSGQKKQQQHHVRPWITTHDHFNTSKMHYRPLGVIGSEQRRGVVVCQGFFLNNLFGGRYAYTIVID